MSNTPQFGRAALPVFSTLRGLAAAALGSPFLEPGLLALPHSVLLNEWALKNQDLTINQGFVCF